MGGLTIVFVTTAQTLTAVPGSVVHGTWDHLNWRDDAGCRDVDVNLFFPIGTNGAATRQTNLAKSICGDCAVREFCLEFALRTNQDNGIWGGHTEEERRVIRRSRRAIARRAALSQTKQAS